MNRILQLHRIQVVLVVQERGEGRQARRGQGKQIQGQRGEENDGGNESVVILT